MGQKETVAAFAGFDGVRVAPLRALAASDVATAAVLAHVPGPDEVAATWVLKHRAERGRVAGEVFARLSSLTEPDAILHVLQMVQYAPDAARPHRADFEPLAGHPRLLVNVWALDALVRTTPPGAEAERDARIAAGLAHRSKAMRARARALAATVAK